MRLNNRWKMVGYTLRHTGELHNTTLEGMVGGKRPPDRPCNTCIEQIKNDAGVESYRTLKEMASDRKEWRRIVAN